MDSMKKFGSDRNPFIIFQFLSKIISWKNILSPDAIKEYQAILNKRLIKVCLVYHIVLFVSETFMSAL